MDAHPELAIPPETLFPEDLMKIDPSDGDVIQKTYEIFVSAANWGDFHIPNSLFYEELKKLTPFSLPNAVRCFYRLYAARFAKSRWGDKTPIYMQYVNLIESVLPEAHFVHIIRDGRAVALSYRTTWRELRDNDGVAEFAKEWAATVRETRRQGEKCSRYMEVRYEQLLRDPSVTLTSICDFIGLQFTDVMLNYHKSASARIGELRSLRVDKPGEEFYFAREDRLAVHARTLAPPDVSRIDQWRNELSATEVSIFESHAGDLLAELDYPLAADI